MSLTCDSSRTSPSWPSDFQKMKNPQSSTLTVQLSSKSPSSVHRTTSTAPSWRPRGTSRCQSSLNALVMAQNLSWKSWNSNNKYQRGRTKRPKSLNSSIKENKFPTGGDNGKSAASAAHHLAEVVVLWSSWSYPCTRQGWELSRVQCLCNFVLPVIQDDMAAEQPLSRSPVQAGLCSEPLKKLEGAKAVDCETPIMSWQQSCKKSISF